MANMSYVSPDDVFCPWNLRPYHDARPRCLYGSSSTTGTYASPKTV